MATYSNLKSALSLRLNLGSGPDGKTRTRTVTLSRVKAAATADAAKAVSDALTPLLAYPVLEVTKTDADSVVE